MAVIRGNLSSTGKQTVQVFRPQPRLTSISQTNRWNLYRKVEVIPKSLAAGDVTKSCLTEASVSTISMGSPGFGRRVVFVLTEEDRSFFIFCRGTWTFSSISSSTTTLDCAYSALSTAIVSSKSSLPCIYLCASSTSVGPWLFLLDWRSTALSAIGEQSLELRLKINFTPGVEPITRTLEWLLAGASRNEPAAPEKLTKAVRENAERNLLTFFLWKARFSCLNCSISSLCRDGFALPATDSWSRRDARLQARTISVLLTCPPNIALVDNGVDQNIWLFASAGNWTGIEPLAQGFMFVVRSVTVLTDNRRCRCLRAGWSRWRSVRIPVWFIRA